VRAMLLEGPHAVGKTAFVAHLAQLAQREGAPYIKARRAKQAPVWGE